MATFNGKNRYKDWQQANLTTKGRSLEALKEEEDRKLIEEHIDKEKLIELVDLIVQSDGKIYKDFKRFLLIHFSTHCRTPDDHVVPAEGAIIELSIEEGIANSWHAFLRPGKVPLGYKSECFAKARKTHNIPLDQDDLYIEDDKVRDQVLKLLFDESHPYDPRPVFCLKDEKQDVELILKLLYDRGDCPESLKLPRILLLEDLLFHLERSLKKHRLTPVSRKPLSSNILARSMLETGTFFNQILPCAFHLELDNFEHCSLALLRNRVFILMDRLCDSFGYKMEPGRNIPIKDLFKTEDSEVEDSQRNIASQEAEIIPDVNIFGTKLTRCGSKNGVTVLPDLDARSVISSAVSSHELGLDSTYEKEETISLRSAPSTVYSSVNDTIATYDDLETVIDPLDPTSKLLANLSFSSSQLADDS